MSMSGKFSLNGRRLNRSLTCPVKATAPVLDSTSLRITGSAPFECQAGACYGIETVLKAQEGS
jgi:hypothetical protein